MSSVSTQPIKEFWIFLLTCNFIFLSSDGSIRLLGMKSVIDNPNNLTHSMIKDIPPRSITPTAYTQKAIYCQSGSAPRGIDIKECRFLYDKGSVSFVWGIKRFTVPFLETLSKLLRETI